MSVTHTVGTTAPNRYLNEKEVAHLCSLALSTLRNWRFLGRGPAYCKIGKAVRYLVSDVETFMEQNRVSHNDVN